MEEPGVGLLCVSGFLSIQLVSSAFCVYIIRLANTMTAFANYKSHSKSNSAIKWLI